MARKPRTKIIKKDGRLFFSRRGVKKYQKERVISLRKGMVRDWTNIGGSFTWSRPLKIRRE